MRERRLPGSAGAACLATLGLFTAGAFLPSHRVWGISVWGYLGDGAPFALAALGALLILGTLGVPESDPAGGARERGSKLAAPALILAGFAALFYLLRARTHFLGDGYLLLGNLTQDQPLVKAWSYGEALLHIAVKKLRGGGGQAAALFSYRLLSLAGGVCLLTAATYSARQLYGRSLDATIFVLGVGTGGYMLLYFGYVEHYALFVLAVALFTWCGLLIVRRRLSRWWVLPLLALALFFHALGLVLLPAAAYLLLRGGRVQRRFARWGRGVRAAIWLALCAACAALFGHYYANDYFLRFAFVPLGPDRFTIEGYTLVAPSHLADWLNLLFLLAPGLLLALVSLRSSRRLAAAAEYRFLALTLAACLGAVFLLDPRLGMPRDWDLFAFAGVPLVTAQYYMLLDPEQRLPRRRAVALAAVVLAGLSLFPRAWVQHVPAAGIALARDYAQLDVRKNRTGVYNLAQYLLRDGLISEYRELQAWAETTYVEDRISARASELVNARRYDEAKEQATRLIAINPMLFSGWAYLGRIYTAGRSYDSALAALRVADGLNPHSPGVLNELGLAYYQLGDRPQAERLWRRSIAIDSLQFAPHWSLARIYDDRGQAEKYAYHLIRAARHRDAPGGVNLELAEHYIAQGRFDAAKSALARARALGVDSATAAEMLAKYPQFQERLK